MWKSSRRMLGSEGLFGALAAILLVTACLQPVAANEVLKWNETTAKAAAANGQNPIQTTRTVAMVQSAVHDALNAIKPRYAAYYYEGRGSGRLARSRDCSRVLSGVDRRPSLVRQLLLSKSAAQALVEEAYQAALCRGSPMDSREAGRHRRRQGCWRSNAGAAQGRWRDALCAVHAGKRSRTVAAASEP